MPFILVRLYGGLGNQLFTYATAFRLAKVNNCKLILDTKSGFIRYFEYKRKFLLNSFSISAKELNLSNFIAYFISLIFPLLLKINRKISFSRRFVILQDSIDFNSHLLDLKINSSKYFEGFWQSEKYFIDVKSDILKEFTFSEVLINSITEKIDFNNSVALHVRQFNDIYHTNQGNLTDGYYQKAINYFGNKFPGIQFWIFSDKPQTAKKRLFSGKQNCNLISEIFPNLTDIQELYLMTQFSFFIIGNSTFSWWGAWLSKDADKIIVAPSEKIDSGEGLWGFDGLLPEYWIKM